MNSADNHNGKEPKYIHLAKEIRKQVDSGVWGIEKPIPTERDISTNFGVSRSTVRKAIQFLTDEGYLRSEHGAGTFIMPESSRENNRFLHSFSDDMAHKGLVASQQILEMALILPSEFIRQQLDLCDSKTKVQKIKRLRLAGTTPVGIHSAYVITDGNKMITEQELLEKKSLYKLLFEKMGLEPIEAIETLGARLPSPAESQLLEIPLNEAVLTCARVTLSSKRKPMEYVEMVYPSSRYNYTIRINRKSFQK